MTVYLDLVLLLNFAVDLLLILGTNRLSGFPPGFLRGIGASALGAVYAAGCMLPEFSFLGGTFWRFACLGLMGIIAFGLNKSAWKRTGVFVLLSMAMGGIAMGMGKSDFSMVLLSALGVWLLSRIGFGGSVGGKEYIPITIAEGERSFSAIALKDTGNSLRDPITGEQVLILGPEAAGRLLGLMPAQLSRPMETVMGNPGRGLRLIPYNSVGQPGGMMLGKRFGNVKLGDKKGNALVAFAPERIGVGQVYQALAGGNL
ncbi:MAG: sigma-E processing peptidase SpoIIGA [Oscillospiraceae bacterium]|nr:sigma-E processing peptidase SpoIIGA [Oscillospiraceae bacterium]